MRCVSTLVIYEYYISLQISQKNSKHSNTNEIEYRLRLGVGVFRNAKARSTDAKYLDCGNVPGWVEANTYMLAQQTPV